MDHALSFFERARVNNFPVVARREPSPVTRTDPVGWGIGHVVGLSDHLEVQVFLEILGVGRREREEKKRKSREEAMALHKKGAPFCRGRAR
jgi:hypothetical protein